MATIEQGDAVVLDIVSDASTVSMFLHQTFGVPRPRRQASASGRGRNLGRARDEKKGKKGGVEG